MKFTIRDILWLTVVVALVLALWQQWARWSASERRTDAVRRHAEALRRELSQAEHNEAVYVDRLAEAHGLTTAKFADRGIIDVDWELADRGIP